MIKKVLLIIFLLSSSFLFADPPDWEQISGTQYSMIMIADITRNNTSFTGAGNNMAAAFGPNHTSTNNDCRAIGLWEEPAPSHNGFWYFTIVGDTIGQEISFRIYDEASDEVFFCNETIQFDNNITIGSPQTPFSLTVDGSDYGEVCGNVTLMGGSGDVTDAEISANTSTTNPDSSGYYTLFLPQGNYSISASLDGYYPQTINNVEVLPGQTTDNINFSLYPDNEELLSVPSRTTTFVDTTVTIPIELYNPDSLQIEGITISMSFDSTVVSYLDASLDNTILENMNYSLMDNSSGDSFTCWIYSNATPVNNSGVIMQAEFQVTTTNPDSTNLIFTDAQLNENPITTSNGAIEVLAGYNISGNIYYYENELPISNAEVILEQQKLNSYTNSDGEYQFNSVLPGSYIMYADKFDQLGGLSSMDASRIARYGIGLIDLNSHQIVAADVTQNSYVSPTDASRVARYGIGLIDSLNVSNKDWVFVSDSVNSTNWPPIEYNSTKIYDSLSYNLYNQDFTGIRLGDVTGNWSKSKPANNKHPKNISASIPDTTTSTSSVMIPINVENLTNMEGTDLTISFEEGIVQLNEVTLDGSMLEDEDYELQFIDNQNETTIWIYSTGDLYSGNGVIAFMNFEVTGVIGDSTDINFSQFMVNEIDYLDNTENGSLNVVCENIDEDNTNFNNQLLSNTPNPFFHSTNIEFSLKKRNEVKVQVYNIKGQLVETILVGEKEEGKHTILWNACNIGNGIYFYRMETDGFVDVKKMINLED